MLEDVKEYLKITWDDEDVKLQNMIDRGQNYLNERTGVELDYTTEGQPKALLLDYCRYAYNNALEYFNENFKSELFRLQLKKAVDADAQE